MRARGIAAALLAAGLIHSASAGDLGMQGKIEGAGKLSGIAQQRALALSADTAKELAEALKSELAGRCPRLLISDDPAAVTRLQQARSLSGKLLSFALLMDRLNQELSARAAEVSGQAEGAFSSRNLVSSVASLQSQVGAVVDLWRLFQSDYKLESFSVENDPDWIAASFLKAWGACPAGGGQSDCVQSTRFPSLADIDRLAARLQSLVDDAHALHADAKTILGKSKRDEDKALLAEIAALAEAVRKFQNAALDPNDKGVAAITVVSPWLRAVEEGACLARIIDRKPEGLVMTRQTLFGTGGKVYLSHTVQLGAIASDQDGAPLALVCRQRTQSATLRLSRLARDKPDPNALPVVDADATVARDCAPTAP